MASALLKEAGLRFGRSFDLAAVAPMRELERAFHEAEVREVADRVSLPMLLERYPGRRGAKNLRALVGSRQPVMITRNDFEGAFLALVGDGPEEASEPGTA